jgi:electron transfer flavoprotein beta subunit
MNAVVLLRMVPDVVEELIVAGNGTTLDTDAIRWKLSESDEHALEEAVLLKEKCGGSVVAIALDAPDVNDALFTAAAKGVDRLIKLAGDWTAMRAPAIAGALAACLRAQPGLIGPGTVVLTGSQAIDDLEGEVAACLSEELGLPYLAVVTSVSIPNGAARATAVKEFSGGLRGEFEVPLPAVLGVQSASKPPRYVPVAKIRAASKSAKIEAIPAAATSQAGVAVRKLFVPAAGGKAEMLAGTPEEISTKIVDALVQRGVL